MGCMGLSVIVTIAPCKHNSIQSISCDKEMAVAINRCEQPLIDMALVTILNYVSRCEISIVPPVRLRRVVYPDDQVRQSFFSSFLPFVDILRSVK